MRSPEEARLYSQQSWFDGIETSLLFDFAYGCALRILA
jgi:hypothetical protein